MFDRINPSAPNIFGHSSTPKDTQQEQKPIIQSIFPPSNPVTSPNQGQPIFQPSVPQYSPQGSLINNSGSMFPGCNQGSSIDNQNFMNQGSGMQQRSQPSLSGPMNPPVSNIFTSNPQAARMFESNSSNMFLTSNRPQGLFNDIMPPSTTSSQYSSSSRSGNRKKPQRVS